jgi:hypothetical protein
MIFAAQLAFLRDFDCPDSDIAIATACMRLFTFLPEPLTLRRGPAQCPLRGLALWIGVTACVWGMRVAPELQQNKTSGSTSFHSLKFFELCKDVWRKWALYN